MLLHSPSSGPHSIGTTLSREEQLASALQSFLASRQFRVSSLFSKTASKKENIFYKPVHTFRNYYFFILVSKQQNNEAYVVKVFIYNDFCLCTYVCSLMVWKVRHETKIHSNCFPSSHKQKILEKKNVRTP